MNLEVFSRKVALPVSAEEAFAWHERPGALDRLIPPWENVRIITRGDGIRNGSRVVLIIHQGPLRLRWVAEHCNYEQGSGQQYWSWISLDDAAGAIHHVLMTDSVQGPVNTVAPDSLSNVAFTKILGRVLSRPSITRVPALAARIALGEMADELLLASTQVRPKRLLDSGYEFRHDSLEDALRHMLGRTN